jgi:kynurenine formamidase
MSDFDPAQIRLGDVRLLDLSVAIENDAPGEMSPPKIDYISHAASAQTVAQAFGCRLEDLVYSNGEGWAVENLTAGSHTGTHIDV